jgi:ATP:corrinoid adenosyltransferase
MNVYMVQFLKGGKYTGEYIASHNFLPNFTIEQVGKPCIKRTKQKTLLSFKDGTDRDIIVRDVVECGPCRFCFQIDETDRAHTKKAYYYIESLIRSGDYDVIILDEITYVINTGFIELDALLTLLKEKHPQVEVIMTGRDAPKELIEACDLVSEMRLQKHYFQQGVIARPGIEY